MDHISEEIVHEALAMENTETTVHEAIEVPDESKQPLSTKPIGFLQSNLHQSTINKTLITLTPIIFLIRGDDN